MTVADSRAYSFGIDLHDQNRPGHGPDWSARAGLAFTACCDTREIPRTRQQIQLTST